MFLLSAIKGIKPFVFLDWLVIGIYFAALIIMSIYLGREQEDQEDYYVGGRKLPWWAVGISTMATQTSAIGFISVPAFVGLKAGGGLKMLQGEFAMPLAMIIVMVFLLPFFRKLKLITVYEYLEMRFSRSVRFLMSAVFLISRGLGTACGVYAAALVLSYCLGVDIFLMIILISVVTVIYDTIGGMKAVVASDVVQMGVLMVGIVLCCIYSLKLVGGFKNVIAVTASSRLSGIDFKHWGINDGTEFSFWPQLIGGIFMLTSYYGCDQTQTQRELSTPSMNDTKYSLILNGFFRFPIGVSYAFLGLLVGAAVVYLPDFKNLIPPEKPDSMLPLFIMKYIPIGIRAVIFSAILAAAMSSLDSSINSLSAVTMRDFVEQFIKIDDEKKALFYSRVSTVCWGVFVIAFASWTGNISHTILEAIGKIGSFFYGPILGAFLLGILFRRSNSPGVISGIIGGILINLMLSIFAKGVFWMWWNVAGCIATIGVGLLVSQLTPPPEEEKLKGNIIWEAEFFKNEKKWIWVYLGMVAFSIFMIILVSSIPKLVGA